MGSSKYRCNDGDKPLQVQKSQTVIRAMPQVWPSSSWHVSDAKRSNFFIDIEQPDAELPENTPPCTPQFLRAMASNDRDVLVALCRSISGADWMPYDWNIDSELTNWRNVGVNSEGRVKTLHVAALRLQGQGSSIKLMLVV